MTTLKFNRRPFEDTFSSFVEDLFSELPLYLKNDFNNSNRKGSVPVNVKETDKSYVLELIAPGFERSDFVISLDQQVLSISAEKKAEKTEENQKTIRNEYGFRSFKRSFTIDDKIDATDIQASYINGVLTLNLPKKVTVKASVKEIKVQ